MKLTNSLTARLRTTGLIFGMISLSMGPLPAQSVSPLIARAEEVRWSRELLGIHYPSDDEASRIIAWQLLTYWQNSPEFVADLEKAKVEWTVKKTQFTVHK